MDVRTRLSGSGPVILLLKYMAYYQFHFSELVSHSVVVSSLMANYGTLLAQFGVFRVLANRVCPD